MSFNSIQGGFSLIEMLMDEHGRPRQWQMPGTTLISTGADIAERMAELLPELEEWWLQSNRNGELGGEHKLLSTRVLVSNHWLEVYAFRLGAAQTAGM